MQYNAHIVLQSVKSIHRIYVVCFVKHPFKDKKGQINYACSLENKFMSCNIITIKSILKDVFSKSKAQIL